jgi:hypothetical protein
MRSSSSFVSSTRTIDTVESELGAGTLKLVARNRVAREEMQPDEEPEQR